MTKNNKKIKIYREVRNSLLGFGLTSVEFYDKGQTITSYNEKGLTRKSRLSGIKTRGKRKTANGYRKIH